MIEVRLTSHEAVPVKMVNSKARVCLGGSLFYVKRDCKLFSGAYSVIPKGEVQTLDTKDKHLYDNITVEKIPFSRNQNSAGGYTVVIG